VRAVTPIATTTRDLQGQQRECCHPRNSAAAARRGGRRGRRRGWRRVVVEDQDGRAFRDKQHAATRFGELDSERFRVLVEIIVDGADGDRASGIVTACPVKPPRRCRVVASRRRDVRDAGVAIVAVIIRLAADGGEVHAHGAVTTGQALNDHGCRAIGLANLETDRCDNE
jgi:hypothetical protein